MEIYLDNKKYQITADEHQLIIKRQMERKDKSDKPKNYGDPRYHVRIIEFIDYLLHEKILASEAKTLTAMRVEFLALQEYMKTLAKELDEGFRAFKKGGSHEKESISSVDGFPSDRAVRSRDRKRADQVESKH